jgi:hypothetical protein
MMGVVRKNVNYVVEIMPKGRNSFLMRMYNLDLVACEPEEGNIDLKMLT